MADSDAEWVGVDFEFGNPGNTPATTTRRPRPAVPVNPVPRPAFPVTESPHDAPEVAASGPAGGVSSRWVGGAVGGSLGVVLVVLIVYMVVLRRRLNKARAAGEDSQYSLRVADVAHLSHMDHTENTYVNTTDLQRFVAAVRAKDKSAAGLPLPPRTSTSSDRKSDPEVTVVRPPMPLPYTAQPPAHPASVHPLPTTSPDSPTESESLYANLQENQALGPPPVGKAPPPKIPPPPTSARRQSSSGPTSPTAIARPAPPPPQSASFPPQVTPSPPQATLSPYQGSQSPPQAAPSVTNVSSSPQVVKPTPPPVALKPKKPVQTETHSPVAKTLATGKPSLPTLPKPGVGKKGKALPPLKLVLTRNQDSSPTPDTAATTLTPDTPTSVSSVTAKVAFLEGKVCVAPRSFPSNTTS